MAGLTYDVWSPDNIKRFQRGMGLKGDGVVGPKTRAAMGTQKGSNWLLGDYNRGMASMQSTVPVQTDSQLFNNGKSYTLSGGRVNKPITGLAEPLPLQNPSAEAGGLGDYGSYNGIGIDKDAYDAIKSSGVVDGLLGPQSTNWVDGLSNYEAIQAGLGGVGLATNIYGMFGDGGSMDVNKKNIELMNQQILNNREEMANRKGYRADIAKAFGPKTGLGV